MRPYLGSTNFTVHTNHHALYWILNLADATGKHARDRVCLIDYDFKIVYPSGVEHQVAAASSRLVKKGWMIPMSMMISR